MSGSAARTARAAATVLTLPTRHRAAEPPAEMPVEPQGSPHGNPRGWRDPGDPIDRVHRRDPGDLLHDDEHDDPLDDPVDQEAGADDLQVSSQHGGEAAVRSSAAPGADDATLCAWITRIGRQDERALEALYDATASRVNGVVLRILQRAALAEEVLEDTYWQVWRQAPRFDATRGRPITWLLSMARSRAIDALRREQRHQHDTLPEDDGADAAELLGAAAPPPQDLLEATRGEAGVHAAIASLEPRSRQLVALAFFRGLTHEEIAAQQEMPLGTVKSLIRRALQQLRRVMEAEHG